MRIGIDVSQTAYEGTGVANLLTNIVNEMIKNGDDNEYILFFSSMRKHVRTGITLNKKNVTLKKFRIPPMILNLLWNRLHIIPIEQFIGNVDIFITSDWTEPPAKRAAKATILYDLIVYKYPEETHNKTEFSLKNFILRPNIVSVQKRKLFWVKKESKIVFCISESTKKDAEKILGIDSDRLKVVYPGI